MAALSKTLTGADAPSTCQWYTAVADTIPILVGEIHFQNTTCSGIWWLPILALVSRLKTCRWSAACPGTAALSAMTLLFGFISAESAVIGLLMGCMGCSMSMITTLFVPPEAAPISRTQMYFSLSMVRLVKEMYCWLMPRLGSLQ